MNHQTFPQNQSQQQQEILIELLRMEQEQKTRKEILMNQYYLYGSTGIRQKPEISHSQT